VITMTDHGPFPPGLPRSNARLYVPDDVTAVLVDAVAAPRIATIIDIDALERSKLARLDRVMRLALDALSHLDVHIVLFDRHDRERAARVHRDVPAAWCSGAGAPRGCLVEARARHPGWPLIAISDDPELFAALDDRDRGIALGPAGPRTRGTIAPGDINIRAALWWMVDLRYKAGRIGWRTDESRDRAM